MSAAIWQSVASGCVEGGEMRRSPNHGRYGIERLMTMAHMTNRDKTVRQTSFTVTHRAGSLHEMANESRPHLNTDFSVDWEHQTTIGGHAHADAENNDVRERFHFYSSHKPVILRCEGGFLSYGDRSRLEISENQFDEFTMLPAPHGGIYLRAGGSRFVEVRDDGSVSCDAFQPSELRVCVRGHQRMQFQSPSGRFLRCSGDHVVADGGRSEDGTLFEIAGDRHPRD